jgi:hypothetical protein
VAVLAGGLIVLLWRGLDRPAPLAAVPAAATHPLSD